MTGSIEFNQCLAVFGATESTLSERQKNALDDEGYLVIPDLIDPEWLTALRDAFERAATDNRQDGGREGGTRHVGSLETRGEAFLRLMTHPAVLAAAWRLLQAPFRCSGMDGRDPLPGHGLQGIHRDSPGTNRILVNALWLLDEYTTTNGATRVVPGSHHSPGKLPRLDPNQPFPGEIIVSAPDGSVLIFDGLLLHGGTRNLSQQSRRVVRCSMEPRSLPRAWGYVPPAFLDPLPPAVACLLDLNGGETV